MAHPVSSQLPHLAAPLPRTVATLVRPERLEHGRPATPATAESVSDEGDAAVTMDTNQPWLLTYFFEIISKFYI